MDKIKQVLTVRHRPRHLERHRISLERPFNRDITAPCPKISHANLTDTLDGHPGNCRPASQFPRLVEPCRHMNPAMMLSLISDDACRIIVIGQNVVAERFKKFNQRVGCRAQFNRAFNAPLSNNSLHSSGRS